MNRQAQPWKSLPRHQGSNARRVLVSHSRSAGRQQYWQPALRAWCVSSTFGSESPWNDANLLMVQAGGRVFLQHIWRTVCRSSLSVDKAEGIAKLSMSTCKYIEISMHTRPFVQQESCQQQIPRVLRSALGPQLRKLSCVVPLLCTTAPCFDNRFDFHPADDSSS